MKESHIVGREFKMSFLKRAARSPNRHIVHPIAFPMLSYSASGVHLSVFPIYEKSSL
jgi:hypothetical protein